MYKQKLKCPSCGNKDITLVQEKIYQEITFTNKRTGWLRKKSESKKYLIPVGNGAVGINVTIVIVGLGIFIVIVIL